MERQIACVARVSRLSDAPEALTILRPEDSIAEVEQLRRMFPTWTGDPDQPMVKLVVRVGRISDASFSWATNRIESTC